MTTEQPPATPHDNCIGRPATNLFELKRFTPFESLAGAGKSHLLALHGVGPRAIRVLQEALESRGLPALTA